MTETVVRISTLEEWKSVLDVWFKQGHKWRSEDDQGYQEEYYCDGSRHLDKGYHEDYFDSGSRGLWLTDDNMISMANTARHDCIEYSEFMKEQQKEDNKMETCYVTQEQLDLIKELKSLPAPLVAIMNKRYGIESLYNELPLNDIEWFSYLSGVIKIEFKVKTPAIEPEDEPLTTPTEEPDANREVTIVFQNGEMKSFTGVTDISLNNGTLTFNYPQGAFGNTIMEATFYTDTISGYLIDTV